MSNTDFVIFGLGNPGLSRIIRHNTGFLMVDALANHYKGEWKCNKKFHTCPITINGLNVTLCKPYEGYNISGLSVNDVLYDCGVETDKFAVIHDDVDLPLGTVRVKKGGSAGGCNGIKSIDEVLCTNQYYRMRIGVGRPETGKVTGDWVCGDFPEKDLTFLEENIFKKIAKNMEKLSEFNIETFREIIR